MPYKKTKIFTFLILLVSIFPGTLILFSQETDTPISSYEICIELDRNYGADQRLVSGTFYHEAHYGSINGHPFCINEEWKKGQVIMDGIVFENLLLKYDIVSNELVLNTLNLSNTSLQVSLKTGNISSFKLDNKQFIVFPGSGNEDKPLFCELVSSGHVDFLLLRKKEMRMVSSGGNDFEYKEYYNNYLRIDDQLIKFRGRRSLIKLFPDHRKELRKYISQQALILGTKNTDERALFVDYCNTLLGEKE